jgi:pyruvate dehydrogenase E1 component alpha subunit
MATTVADVVGVPSPEPVQLLRPDGTLTGAEGYTVDLSDGEYLAMYRSMVVTRALDQQFINLQRQGQLALYPSMRGQEAAQVGAVYALEPEDMIFPQYRELGFWLVRGIDPMGIGLHWRGVWQSSPGMVEHHSAPISICIGTHALHAVGYAMGASLDGAPIVSIACIGDGATSEGDPQEAMNFAGVFQAPCIFYVQNNQWAISVPVAAQTHARTIADKAVAYGMPGVRIDGNDVLACYAVVKAAADRARAGGGPMLIEAVTYRMEAHTTSDDPTRYRPPEDLELWSQRDPIARLRRFLEQTGRWSDEVGRATEEEAAATTQRLRDAVFDMPDGDPLELFEHVFVDPTPALREQAAEFERELRAGDA